ncbi:dicarboxylate transporter/tellurite-resistance protein TehA (plasmid) [Novosphingobium resinovorum]|uniref:dicarboxylate transporter/tellurite-resistance protein TehA n=1 Tax=Novosphingobium TaxID=165696 RepID=UPI001B3C6F2C|nr:MULTISPECIES: dicarboxylate transporter/tellurite-resistance protein TehA [Novosphingobium]MBF7015054.1 dicarboxylate transporter/tellurite-resistance protein TehA [Novosphingobium sp. HR1a]WJM29738.1 dicarboxylate transporter/tellurite-resistance protein TehA [Novosphingobium resinovorum]
MAQAVSRTLPRVPASFFGIVLGLAGLSNAWRAAHAAWGLPVAIAEVILICAIVAWAAVAVLYGLKWVVTPAIVAEEAKHPVQCCFIGLAGVSTLLIAQGVLPSSRSLAIGLFLLGAGFTVCFALWRTGLLWRGGRADAATTPVLYLPMVAGGFVGATVASALGWRDWGQLAFGAGFFTWLAVESVILLRLYTAEPMPPALRPTMGIQLAPPAVGAVSYLSVGQGAPDLVAHLLIGYALLQAALLLRMSRWISEQPFGASYWAFTFGATALAGAMVRLAPADHGGAIATLSPVVFALANIVVLGIAIGTLRQLFTGRLLPPISGPDVQPTSAR